MGDQGLVDGGDRGWPLGVQLFGRDDLICVQQFLVKGLLKVDTELCTIEVRAELQAQRYNGTAATSKAALPSQDWDSKCAFNLRVTHLIIQCSGGNFSFFIPASKRLSAILLAILPQQDLIQVGYGITHQ